MSTQEAIRIWNAGIQSVNAARLVETAIELQNEQLTIAGHVVPGGLPRSIFIVGAGKAGAGMTDGALRALQDLSSDTSVDGWVNVPEDCVPEITSCVDVFPARPAGRNLPTAATVHGTQQILKRLRALGPDDLCIALISGGGSALLCSPTEGVTLEDKLIATRLLASAGAPIEDLNQVRRCLSDVKGGGLAAACGAPRLISLIISDIVGDPLPLIASGPTVPAPRPTPAALIEILNRNGIRLEDLPVSVRTALTAETTQKPLSFPTWHLNEIIGRNAVAVDAAATAAQESQFETINLGSEHTGIAAEEGAALMAQLIQHRDRRNQAPSNAMGTCLLSGGEPTVRLNNPHNPGKGGRNQELVLGALHAFPNPEDWEGITLLSGGTDGEDGPTDAAGAFADADICRAMHEQQLDPADFLARNDSYHFFAPLNALLQTGPTHTNVMDLRVGLVTV